MNRTIKTTVAAFALLAGLAMPVTAQRRGERTGVDVSIGKRVGDHEVSFGIHFGGRARPETNRPVRRGHEHVDASRRWVPAHCETITEKVWIPERCERVWVPPVFNECVDSLGRRHRTIVREGYWNTVTHPGRWEFVTRTITVPGHWVVCAATDNAVRGFGDVLPLQRR
ncbi:MAG: hypothetical protein R3F56_04260 [Planctomycetota bacterium]